MEKVLKNQNVNEAFGYGSATISSKVSIKFVLFKISKLKSYLADTNYEIFQSVSNDLLASEESILDVYLFA